MKRKRTGQRVLSLLVTLIASIVLTACSGIKAQKKTSPSDQTPQQMSAKETTIYYDFGDILLPNQLSINNNKTFVMSASGLTAGVLSLKGRVEINSLLSFFESKMPIDGWTLENKFRGLRNMLLFTKQNRNCVITIDEGRLNTLVEIWVAPTVRETESGLHK